MSDAALVVDQIRFEQRAYWRNPAAAFFTFAFPVVLFVILTAFAGGQTDNEQLGQGVKLSQYYTPSILAYGIMSACFLSVALAVVRQRESGLLKRYRGTPLPAWVLVAGLVGSAIIVAVLMTVIVVVVAELGYGVHLPASHLLPLAVAIVVAALAFCALGIAASVVIPNADAGPAIVNLPFFVLVFISGTYFPISGTLADIAAWFPLRPFILLLYRAFTPHPAGGVWSVTDLRDVAIWGVVATVFAARRFRWSPRHR